MEIGRILPGVAVLNSKIYVVGGEQESQILANGEWYDTQADTWNKVIEEKTLFYCLNFTKYILIILHF